MKKIISVLLSLALLLGCAAAYAETAEKVELGVLKAYGEFSIQAPIPEGYTQERIYADDADILIRFKPEDEKKPTMVLCLSVDDEWEAGTKLNNVSAEDLAAIESSFYEESPDYEITYSETAYGTKLLLARLNNSMLVIYTLYEGYEITLTLLDNAEVGLTQEMIDAGIKLLSDTDFVAPEQ